MASPVEIVNLALDAIGHTEEITDLDAETATERLCRRTYDQARDSMLAAYDWNFARKVQSLVAAPDPIEPLGWTYGFIRPTDALKIRRVLGAEFIPTNYFDSLFGTHYSSGGVIYSMMNALYLEYTYDPGVERYPALFVDALAASLAWRLSYPITKDLRLREANLGPARAAFIRATTVDANEDDNRAFEWESSLLFSRY